MSGVVCVQGLIYMVQELMPGGDLFRAIGNDDPNNRQLGWYNRCVVSSYCKPPHWKAHASTCSLHQQE